MLSRETVKTFIKLGPASLGYFFHQYYQCNTPFGRCLFNVNNEDISTTSMHVVLASSFMTLNRHFPEAYSEHR